MLALINLALCLSNFPVLANSVPLTRFSINSGSRTEWCSRKVNSVLELAHIVEVLGIFHEIVHKLCNRKSLSRDNEPTRSADAIGVFLRQTGLFWRKVSCELKR